MGNKSILKIFLIIIFIIGTLNFAYANGSDGIGQNQAKKVAQKYLDSHNLPYIAIANGSDARQIKVKDTKTGEIKWISYDTWGDNFQFINTNDTIPSTISINRYVEFDTTLESDNTMLLTTFVVQINDKEGKNVGQIYINDETGKIQKVVINGKVLKDSMPEGHLSNSTHPAYITDTTNQIPQDTLVYVGIILVTVSILIIAGAGYWFKYKK